MHHHQYTLTVPKTSCREFAKVKVSPHIYLCMQRYYSLPIADDMNQVIHVKNVYSDGLKRCRFLYDCVKYIVFIDKSCGFRWLFSDFFSLISFYWANDGGGPPNSTVKMSNKRPHTVKLNSHPFRKCMWSCGRCCLLQKGKTYLWEIEICKKNM